MPEEEIRKILIITRNLPPLVGGMERLNWHMADELSKHAEVHVISPKGSARMKPESVMLTEVPLHPLPLFLVMAFCKGLYRALSDRPDIILAGSGLTAPIAWLLSIFSGARSAAYLHGFDITVNHASYKKLWRPTFKKLDRVIVNSTPTRELALNAGVPESKISIVFPGVTLPQRPQPAATINAFKAQQGLLDKKILLSVGRLTTRKGLREFVEKSLPLIVRSEPNAILVVVGEAPKNSLGAGIQTVASIQAQATKSGVAGHIKFLGVITDRDLLATVYEAADVHVFPVRHIPDDPEGFGMVAIEAAAHGLPTVAFATGGVVDAVSIEQSGYLAAPGDYSAMVQLVLQILSNKTGSWQKSTATFTQKFTWLEFGLQVNTVLGGTAIPSPQSKS
ncbi:glycosyltransferase family 4 protein [Halopseudomonas sp.]|uniref:glycosyltransferase family 4 protein n=1 Tax=Halopseudomonas sp. TaxID=2901191 RepID=UPI003001ADC7